MEKELNVLSLFDGISCGQVALQKAGIKVNNYFASEIDKKAILVTQENFPNTKQIGNVEFVNQTTFKSQKINLLMGGSPCQSFSRQGDQSGFQGKSNLFWQFARLKKELNPDYFLLENVVMRKDWMNAISEELCVQPILIDSKYFSAQKRQRLYWTNLPIKEIIDSEVYLKDILEHEYIDPNFNSPLISFVGDECRVKQATKKGYDTAEIYDSINIGMPKSKTRRGRVAKEKTNTLDTGCNFVVRLPGGFRAFTQTELERLQTLPDGYTSQLSMNQAKKAIGNGWNVETIVHILAHLKK